MASAQPVRIPTHLRVVGILSLLWNAFGAYDYIMTQTGGLEYFESMGFDAEAYAWYQAHPAWATAGFAVGVWLSLAGAVLLLMRSRHAALAFLLSFVGAVVSFCYQFISERPASLDGPAAILMPIAILLIILLQWYYARRQTKAGVLK